MIEKLHVVGVEGGPAERWKTSLKMSELWFKAERDKGGRLKEYMESRSYKVGLSGVAGRALGLID